MSATLQCFPSTIVILKIFSDKVLIVRQFSEHLSYAIQERSLNSYPPHKNPLCDCELYTNH